MSLIDTITWGEALPDSTITVYFVPQGQSRTVDVGESYTAEAFNAYEKAQFQKAFDLIESVIDVQFQIVTSASAGANADFQLVMDTNEIGDFLGVFNPPGEPNAGVGVFNGAAWDRTQGGDLEVGGFGFVTIMHELLHGMGLAHPHDDGGTSTIMAGVTREFDDFGDNNLNQGVYTTMTYNSGFLTSPAGGSPAISGRYGYEVGPMALDIAALQALYGTTAAKTGNTIYRLPEQNRTGTYWQTIWDTGGTDEIRYGGIGRVEIDLRAATLEQEDGGGGFLSAARGIAGGFTIAHGVVIENASGGSGDDDIQGNDVANKLVGNGGDDLLRGRKGNDTLQGGGGDDRLLGAAGNDRLFGNNGKDDLFGGADRDRMGGGNGRDLLDGEGGNDSILGNDGRDLLFGGSGNDRMNGGGGDDELVGGTGDDRIYGGDGDDEITGGAGTDVMTGSSGGDLFIFRQVDHSPAGAGRDVITDFNRSIDTIDLRAIDADTTRGGNQAFDFVGTGGLRDAGDLRIVKQGADWLVRADVDGDGRGDLEILLQGADRPGADSFLL